MSAQTPERSDAVPRKSDAVPCDAASSTGALFDGRVRAIAMDLRRQGYKVELQEVHGHYKGQDGETYNQRGYAIRVYPWKDRS